MTLEKGYFFTGFPGFICNQLIREVLKRNHFNGIIYVLVLPEMVEKANKELTAIISEYRLEVSPFQNHCWGYYQTLSRDYTRGESRI